MMAGIERPWQFGGLPAELTRCIGRDVEVAEVGTMLSHSGRLVTLIGVGGVGKTRVGLRVAREVRGRFPEGVHFVELSALRDPDLLPNIVSAVLDLPERSDSPDGSQLDVLISYLAERRLLLVLDTCEHLIDASARFARTVLRGCPQVRILATSRQPLDVPGEQLLSIMPLHTPDPDEPDALSDGATPDAMTLFAERAAAALRGFELTDANRKAVASLCHRLDGIPLAIELAAVRLRAVPLERLLELLDDRFRLLTGGNRSTLPRHQTLRTAVDWSYELCTTPEQLLWARLSVFPGDFGLTDAERVCAGGRLPADEVLERLIALVDKAIVLRADTSDRKSGSHAPEENGPADTSSEPNGPRYRMLDTIREYGTALLSGIGEAGELGTHHRDYFFEMATEFASHWLSNDEAAWLRRLRRELPHLRQALEFCCESGPADVAVGLEMATALWGLWLGTGRIVEGCHWLERLLELHTEPDPVRMRALISASDLTLLSGRHERGSVLLEEAAELARQYDDPSACAYVAKNRLNRSILTGDHGSTPALFAEARARFADLADTRGEAWTLLHASGAAMVFGRNEEALRLCQETVAILRAPDERWIRAFIWYIEGAAHWGLGRFDRAEEALRGALTTAIDVNHTQALAFSFDTLAWVRAAQRQFESGARNLGTAAKLWEKFDQPRAGIANLHRANENAVALTQRSLGQTRFRELFEEGAALPLHRAVALAVNPRTAWAEAGGTSEPSPWALLTAREQEIAVLVAEGLSNRQIAERLVVSKRTVDSHLEHISRKLGYTSRSQTAELAQANAPDRA